MRFTRDRTLATALVLLALFVAPTLHAADREAAGGARTATAAIESPTEASPCLSELLLSEASFTPAALGAGPVGCAACLWGCMQEFNACRHSCHGGDWQECLDDCVTQQEYCQNIECAPACGY